MEISADGRAGDRGDAAFRSPRCGRRGSVLGRRTRLRRGPLRRRAAHGRWVACRRDAARLQRPHACARIWRRGIHRAPRHRVFLELLRPAPVSSGARPSTTANHRRRMLLRRCPRGCLTPAPRLRAGRPSRPHRDQRDRERRHRREHRGRAGVRRGLLFRSGPQPRRLAPGVAAVESSQHALGWHRIVARGCRSDRHSWRAMEDRGW